MAEIIPIRWPRQDEAPDPDKIALAADRIRRGEIIAIPTDTLYCLIADPFNLNAVSRVYRAKSRPSDRSLPMFVASIDQAAEMAQHLPSIFYLLAHRYWPGPLSMIVEAGGSVPLKATGNTRRLSLRQPKSPIAAQLLAEMGTPLIATSANISGNSTCWTAAETNLALGDSVSLIFEAETAESAPHVENVQFSESLIIDTPTISSLPPPATSPYPYAAIPTATTIDLTTPGWRMIREGVIRADELRDFLGE